MLQELVDYRLAAYEARRRAAGTPSTSSLHAEVRGPGLELPYFPNLKIACGHFRTGRTDAEEHRHCRLPTDSSIRRATSSRALPATQWTAARTRFDDGDYLLLELLSSEQRRLDHRRRHGDRTPGRSRVVTTSICCESSPRPRTANTFSRPTTPTTRICRPPTRCARWPASRASSIRSTWSSASHSRAKRFRRSLASRSTQVAGTRATWCSMTRRCTSSW